MLFAARAWAPVLGVFPGLPQQISNSHDIVVGEILTEGPPKATDGFGEQRVRLLAILKGDLIAQREVAIELRGGLLWPFPTYFAVAEYLPGERYVLFISRASRGADMSNILLNAQGSAFWVPREVDLSALPSTNVRDKIEFIIKETGAYLKDRSKDLEGAAARFVGD
jgi:hypothetical protein